VKSKLLKLVNQLRLGNDVVYNPKTHELDPDYGYLVGVNRSSEKYSSLEASDLRSFISRNKHQFYQLGRYMSVYHQDDSYVLNINELVDNQKDAFVLAKIRKEPFVFDNSKKELIYF